MKIRDGKKHWRVFSRKVAYKNPWFQVAVEDIQKPDGFRGKYFIVERGNIKDFVVVIAREEDDLYLVKQWRPTLKRYTLEFVAGSITRGEKPLVAAKREIVEEIGMTAGKWTFLGREAVAPGFSSQYGRYYLATSLTLAKQKFSGELGEKTTLIRLKRAKFDEMIYNGKIIDGATLTAYLLLLAWEKKI